MHAAFAVRLLFPCLCLPVGCSSGAVDATDAPAGTSVYRHATGLTFHHPSDWRVRKTPAGGLSLIPGDLRTDGGQPGEALTLMGQPAAGISSASDVRVPRFVAQFVTGGFPHLRATGGPDAFTVEGRACVELRFAGVYAGTEFRAAAHATILADTVLVAFTLTSADRFDGRRDAMDGVFRSLRMPRPGSDDTASTTRDPNLVGRWCHTHIYHSGDFTSTVVRYLDLRADGTCQEGGRTMASTSHSSIEDGGGGGVEARGRWHTDGGQVVIRWTNGDVTMVSYQTNGRSMLWRAGGGTKLWERAGR